MSICLLMSYDPEKKRIIRQLTIAFPANSLIQYCFVSILLESSLVLLPHFLVSTDTYILIYAVAVLDMHVQTYIMYIHT